MTLVLCRKESRSVDHGTFWYYCNVIPQNGSDGDGQELWENVLVAKGGGDNSSLGRFNGRCPVLPNHSRAGDIGAAAVRRFGTAKAEAKVDKVCLALGEQNSLIPASGA